MACVSALSRETLAERAHIALRTAILSGRFKRDERLIQEDLANELGVSRIPIRDALRALEAEGLLRMDERGGHFVVGMDPEDTREIYELRLLLEPQAAAAALPRISDADREELFEIADAMIHSAKNRNLEDYVRLNRTFHLSLYEHSGMRRTQRIIENLWSGLPPMAPIAVPGQLRNSVIEHDAILAALKNRSVLALRSAMVEHITHAQQLMLAYLATRDEEQGFPDKAQSFVDSDGLSIA